MTRTFIKTMIAGLTAATLVAPALANSGQKSFSAEMSAEEMSLFAAGLAKQNPGGSNATVYQQGNNNAAGIAQNGKGNTGVVFQQGNGHHGTVTQNGNNNAGGLFQFGKNTDGHVAQNGNGNNKATFQFGW